MNKPRREWTSADYRQHTEEARRLARFKFAKKRITQITSGAPALTTEQLSALACLILSGGDTNAT